MKFFKKLPRFIKLNNRGFSHHLVIALVVVGVAVAGTAYLVASHADTPAYIGQMGPGQTLSAGQTIPSTNGDVFLDMQTDGNLVLYTSSNSPIWSTGTNGTGNNNRLVMQTDGNLVVYTSSNQAVWQSHTYGSGSSNHIAVQTDGNAVIYTSSGQAVWQSGTSGREGAPVSSPSPSPVSPPETTGGSSTGGTTAPHSNNYSFVGETPAAGLEQM